MIILWQNIVSTHQASIPQFPYFGASGLNAGVLLLNLSRLRLAFPGRGWLPEIQAVVHQHPREDLVYGDQDILNVMFHKVISAHFYIMCSMSHFETLYKAKCGKMDF